MIKKTFLNRNGESGSIINLVVKYDITILLLFLDSQCNNKTIYVTIKFILYFFD